MTLVRNHRIHVYYIITISLFINTAVTSFTFLTLPRHQYQYQQQQQQQQRQRPFERRSKAAIISLQSSIGGGRQDRPSGPGGDGNSGGKGPGDDTPLGDFLSGGGDDDDDADNTKSTRRKQRADARLPLNFRSDDGSRDEEFFVDDDGDDDDANEEEDDDDKEPSTDDESSSSTALERIQSSSSSSSSISNLKDLSSNPYMETISRLTPSEMILRFTSTANPQVQDAVKTTILGLIGNLPRAAFETAVVTTGQRLASLMFQLQMTGYMFKNAEYRMALSRPLGEGVGGTFLLTSSSSDDDVHDDDNEEDDAAAATEKDIKGKIKVTYESSTPTADDDAAPAYEMEVDAKAYLSELRNQVKNLKNELRQTRRAKEDSIRKDLLLYIRTLPPQELKQLTGTMSEDVLDAMKGLVNNVMNGIGSEDIMEEEDDDDDEDDTMEGGGSSSTRRVGGGVRPDTVMEQSGEAMAQLCMWQLVVGYNLRELEVREEMKKALLNGSKEEDIMPNDGDMTTMDDDDDN